MYNCLITIVIIPNINIMNNSLIFKTIKTDLDGATNKLGIFNRSFSEIMKAYSNGGIRGVINNTSPGITASDINNIQRYNESIENGTSSQTAWNQTMLTSSRTAQDLVSSANGAIVTTDALTAAQKRSSIAAKVAATAHKTLAMAGNMVANMAINYAINGMIQLFTKAANSSSDAKEASDNFANSLKSSNSTISANDKKIQNINIRYLELSKGVNALGQNISLTSSNYEEYKSLISQISEIMPHLTALYNTQGEKIGFQTGKLKDLNAEYDKYQKKIATEFVTEGNDGITIESVFDDYNNQRIDYDNIEVDSLEEAAEKALHWGKGLLSELDFVDVKDLYSNNDILSFLNEYRQFAEESKSKFIDELSENDDKAEIIKEILDISLNDVKEMDDNAFENLKDKLQINIDKYLLYINEAAEKVSATSIQIAKSRTDFWNNLTSNERDYVTTLLSNMSDDFLQDFLLDDEGNLVEDNVSSFIKKLINAISDKSTGVSLAFSKLMYLDPESSELSLKKYLSTVNRYSKIIADALDLSPNQVLSFFGFEDNYEKSLLEKGYGIEDKIDGKLSDLTLNEYLIAVDLDLSDIPEGTLISLNELKSRIKDEIDKSFVPISFESLLSDDSEYKDTMNELQKLAISGELSPELLASTSEYSEILNATKLSAEELYQKINETAISNASLTDMFNTVQTLDDIINNVNEDIENNGEISFSTLQKIASQYPTLEKYVLEYTSGVEGAQENLIDILSNLYENDLNNYIEYYKMKLEIDKTYWSNYSHETNTETRYNAEVLGVDLTSFTNYQDAEKAINKKLQQIQQERKDVIKAPFGGPAYQEYMLDSLKNQEDKLYGILNDMKNKSDNYTNEELDNLKDSIKNVFSDPSKTSDSTTAFDWLETKLSSLTDKLDTLKTKVDNTYSSWGNRNAALAQTVSKTNEAINLQSQAYSKYMSQADSVSLPDTYKNLVQNGSLVVSEDVDSETAEKIDAYKNWYDKAQQCLKTQEELNASLNELNQIKFDNIQSQYDLLNQKSLHYQNMIQSQIDLLEMKGLYANDSYYNNMSSLASEQIATLEKEKSQLIPVLNSVDKDSEAWYSMYLNLLNIDEEIAELINNLTEYDNCIRDINWEIFQYLEESLGRITGETEYLIELMSNKDLYDKNGNITDYGTAAIGLHAAAYDVYKQQAQDYFEEVKDLQMQLVSGAGKDVLEQYNSMVDAHQDSVLAAESEKQAILDLVEEGYNSQLDAIQALVDKKKEALNVEKDLYDYQKSIKEKTDNISSLEKQQISFADDDSEETMAKIQQIKVQLEEAKADLKESEYEKYLSDTETMLDQLTVDYQNWINERLENSDKLLSDIITQVQTKSDDIMDTLNNIALENNTAISDSLVTVFGSDTPFSNSLTSIPDKLGDVSTSISGTTAAINNLINKIAGITETDTKNPNAGYNTAGTSDNSNPPKTPDSNSDKPTGNNDLDVNKNQDNNKTSKSLLNNILISRKDYYPKNKLNINTSIVDRLKYYDKDSSYSARATYWSKLFPSNGAYTGSAVQNTKLLNYLKGNGYKSGTSYVPESGYNWTQEDGEELIVRAKDGAILTPLTKGDAVLNSKATENLYKFMNNPKLFTQSLLPKMNLKTNLLDSLNTTKNNSDLNMSIGDVNINLPNVTNYSEFRNELVKDSNFEKSMLTMVNNAALGKSTKEKIKYCK